MKFSKNMLITICGFFIIIFAGCGAQKGDLEDRTNKPVPVKIQQVSTGNISREYTYAARVKPKEQVTVIPEASGKVMEVYFDIGDAVREGDTLFQIDEESVQKNIRDMEKQVEALDKSIELQQLSLESAKGEQYEQQMLQLEQQLKSAQINYNTAQKSYNDIKALYEKGMASTQQYDQAEASYQQAEVALESAKENYALYIDRISHTNIESKEKQLEQTRIQKEQLLLSLENLYDMLDDTSVKSPISGVVASRNIEKNQMVTMQTAAFTIIQTETLFLDVGVSEGVVGRIQVGDSVAVSIDSIEEEPFSGGVYAIAPSADERTSTYLVKIKLENPDNRIKPGMFAEVSFAVDNREQVVVVPINSVLFDSDGQFVYVVNEANEAEKVFVKTGIDNGTYIEIADGLSVDDLLIVEGQTYLGDNPKVRIIEELDLEGLE